MCYMLQQKYSAQGESLDKKAAARPDEQVRSPVGKAEGATAAAGSAEAAFLLRLRRTLAKQGRQTEESVS